MSRIHIARNRQPLGQFTPEEVAEGLQSGEFLPADLAWQDPMESWKPLAEFENLPKVEPRLEPPVLPVLEPEVMAPVEPAWERRAEMGFFKALIATVRQVFAAPAATYKVMKLNGGLITPLIFFVTVFTLTTWVAMGYQIAVIMVNPEAIFGAMTKQLKPSFLIGSQIAGMVMAPMMIAISAFVSAGILHLIFLALGAVRNPFEATFRAFCYAVAPASVFQLIPICGGTVYLAIAVVLLILAMREAQQTDTMRATIGVILPAVLGCGLFLGAYALMASAMASQGLLK